MKISYKISLIFIFFLLASCAEYQNKVQIKKDEKEYYSSTGFTLIYNDALFEQRVIKKKMNNDKIQVMHAFLKVNTSIKIINSYKKHLVSAMNFFSGKLKKG